LKFRKLTRINQLELFLGLLPASLILGPFLLLGMLGMILTAVTGFSGLPQVSRELLPLFFLLALIGLAALGSLWLLVLVGPEEIRRWRLGQWFILGSVLSGTILAVWAAWAVWPKQAASQAQILFQMIQVFILAGPAAVGIRYLCLYFFRGQPSSR